MYRQKNRKPIEIGKLPFAEECNPCVFFPPEIEISLCSWMKEPQAGRFEWNITDPNELGYGELCEGAAGIAERLLVHYADEYIMEHLMGEKGCTPETEIKVGRKKLCLGDVIEWPTEYDKKYANGIIEVAYGSLGNYKKIHKKITRALEKKYKEVHRSFFNMLEDGCEKVLTTIHLCLHFLPDGTFRICLGDILLKHDFEQS